MNYADVDINDLSLMYKYIKQRDDFRMKLDGTRAIIKWSGDAPQPVIDLGYTIRNQSEAILYYNNPTNGWTEVVVDPYHDNL